MRSLFILSFLLIACGSSQPKPTPETPQQMETKEVAKVESCLTSDSLWIPWGECNVQKTVYDAIPKLSRCVRNAKSGSYPKEGEIDFSLHLLKNGKVKSAKILAGRTKNRSLNICLQKELKFLQFAPPPAGKKPELTVPLSFKDLQ